MAYCDYDFYKTKYYGNVVAEADFPRLAEKASDRVDLVTFNRINDDVMSDELISVKVKKAVCALAEIIGDVEKAEAMERENGGMSVSSVSSGSESISYNNNSVIGSIAFDKKAQTKLFYETAREYLSGTGLLYAGGL